MFKNLTGDGLGVSARQNEMVELALTYGFKGIDIDVTEMVSRIATFGEDFAKRYISSAQKSAKLKIGSFKLPISILGEDSEFEARLPKLEQAADFAASIEAMRCVTDVPPGSNHPPITRISNSIEPVWVRSLRFLENVRFSLASECRLPKISVRITNTNLSSKRKPF